MDQHTFVKERLAYYREQGLTPGNPEDGEWQDAHYPAPDPEGNATVPLLYNDHQIQGILQSEEYGRVCFWVGHTRKFLTQGPFVENWFELWNLYDKWVGERMKALNKEKDDLGRSVFAMKGTTAANLEKDDLGRSVNAVKGGKAAAAVTNAEKDENGKSVNAVKGGKAAAAVTNAEKDENGKSVNAVKRGKKSAAAAANAEKDENGKSVNAVKGGKKTASQVWESTKDGFRSHAGGVANHNKARGWDPAARVRIS